MKIFSGSIFFLLSAILIGSCSRIQYAPATGKLYRDFGGQSHYYSDSANHFSFELLNGFDFSNSLHPFRRRDVPAAIRNDIAIRNGQVLFMLRWYLSPVYTVVQKASSTTQVDTTLIRSRTLGSKAHPVFLKQQWHTDQGNAYLISSYATQHSFVHSKQDPADSAIAESNLDEFKENWKSSTYENDLLADTNLAAFQKASLAFKYSKFNYLYPSTLLQKMPVREYDYYEGAAWYSSFVGDYRLALKQKDSITDLVEDSAALPPYHLVNALQTIVDSARHHRVVMLNEAHNQPLHRRFASELVKALAPLGYKHLFIETLVPEADLNGRGYPLQSDGYYSSEPNFGNLLRTALKGGYILHDYDNDSDGVARELGEAQVLSTFLKSTQDKMIVYCGYGHLNETPADSMMGSLFRISSGEDPLTVDQLFMTERGSPDYEATLYRSVAAHMKPDELMAILTTDPPTEPAHFADIQMAHPRTRYLADGRPEWLLKAGYDTTLAFSFTDKKYQNCLLQLFDGAENKKESYWNLIPILNTRLTIPDALHISLNKGRYTLMVTDVLRNVLYEKVLDLH